MLVISWAAVFETPFLSNISLIWSTPLVVMFCLQLEDELPPVGLLSLCCLEVAVDELLAFLVKGGTKFETAKLVGQATFFLFGRNSLSSRLVE